MRVPVIASASVLAILAIACASPYPLVLSANSERVAIEFEIEGSLEEASKLAEAECARFGKTAQFDAVDQIATPSTRVAKYACVSSGAPAATGE